MRNAVVFCCFLNDVLNSVIIWVLLLLRKYISMFSRYAVTLPTRAETAFLPFMLCVFQSAWTNISGTALTNNGANSSQTIHYNCSHYTLTGLSFEAYISLSYLKQLPNPMLFSLLNFVQNSSDFLFCGSQEYHQNKVVDLKL